MLTPEALAGIRASTAKFLPDSARIADYVITADDSGGEAETWTLRAGIYKVRLGMLSDLAAYPVAGRLEGSVNMTASFEALTPINERDLFKVGQNVYSVIAVLAPATIETTRRALVTQTQEPNPSPFP